MPQSVRLLCEKNMINELIKRYPCLEGCRNEIENAVDRLTICYEKGGKLLLCGNGGSAADCEHISGELMKSFRKKRLLSAEQKRKMAENLPEIAEIAEKLEGALPAISLPSLTSFNTAFSNDADPCLVYAQALVALANEGDVLMAISTSGNSENIVCAAKTAKALGLTVIALTGKGGGKLKGISDVAICVPEEETYKTQELHQPVYHCICSEIEEKFFG